MVEIIDNKKVIRGKSGLRPRNTTSSSLPILSLSGSCNAIAIIKDRLATVEFGRGTCAEPLKKLRILYADGGDRAAYFRAAVNDLESPAAFKPLPLLLPEAGILARDQRTENCHHNSGPLQTQ